jgi:hypothetical protein
VTKQDKPSQPEVIAALGYFRSTTNRHDLVDVLAAALGIDPTASNEAQDAQPDHTAAANAPAEETGKQEAPAEEPAKPARGLLHRSK